MEAIIEGMKEDVDMLIGVLRQGPPMARVERVEVEWGSPSGTEQTFQIWY